MIFHGAINGLNSELKKQYETVLSEKVQNIIKSAKIEEIIQQEGALKQERIGFIEKLFGKTKLQEARLKALQLKKEEIRSEDINTNLSEQDSIITLLDYCRQNVPNSAIKSFLSNYSQICDNNDIKKPIDELIKETPENEVKPQLPTIYHKQSIFQIRKQTKQIVESNVKKRLKIDSQKRAKAKSSRKDIKVENSESKKTMLRFVATLESIINDHTQELETEKLEYAD